MKGCAFLYGNEPAAGEDCHVAALLAMTRFFSCHRERSAAKFFALLTSVTSWGRACARYYHCAGAYGLRLSAVDYIRNPVVKEVLLARLALHMDNADKRLQLKLLKEQQTGAGGVQPDKLLHMKEFLTKTEFSVALLVARGYTNDEIGKLLNYSAAYVKKVVSRVFDRLDIDKRGEVNILHRPD